jgi:hypothetical protein
MQNDQMHLTVKDIIAAAVPAVSSAALGIINQLVGVIAGVLGILYLLWKWKRELKD